ncbi:hypothetical protein [Sandaracinus amylolyticus]|uniref:hypothetical protein n=1 Tax=Sandaracinus amylolyticus TaxID=927083 RepID=UPI001F374041|nr:hypothetical protein [Sandaracinus amylolyticus]
MRALNTCAVHSGRLMEIAVDAGYGSATDVDDMISKIGATMSRLPPTTRVVIAADWRGCHLMPPPAAERAHVMLRATNDRIERSAILGSTTSSVEMLQFMRLVRESQHPSRRVFQDPREMSAYLGELLTPSERRRLDAFLFRARPSA